MENEREPNHIIPVHEVVHAVKFSPYNWCNSLLAIGTYSRVSIFNIKLPGEEHGENEIKVEKLREFHHSAYVTVLSWSPKTNLVMLPKCVRFATAGGDKKIRIFTSDLKNEDNVMTLESHTDYINNIAFDPESGDLASVSDDHSCIIWSSDGSFVTQIRLSSPGMSVAWHKDDPGKIMIAELKGIIRFYNVSTRNPVMSLDCRNLPLMQADWSSLNSILVGCVSGNDWYLWDTSLSSRPSIQKLNAHTDGCTHFAIGKTNECLIATRGNPNTLKVENTKTNQELLRASFISGSGISWHSKLSIIAAGGDRKVCLWKIDLI